MLDCLRIKSLLLVSYFKNQAHFKLKGFFSAHLLSLFSRNYKIIKTKSKRVILFFQLIRVYSTKIFTDRSSQVPWRSLYNFGSKNERLLLPHSLETYEIDALESILLIQKNTCGTYSLQLLNTLHISSIGNMLISSLNYIYSTCTK